MSTEAYTHLVFAKAKTTIFDVFWMTTPVREGEEGV